MNKHLKWLKLSFLLFFLSLSYAEAKKDLFLYGQFGSYDFSVKTKTSSASVNGLGAYSIGLGYAFADQWLASVSMELMRSQTLTGDAATGLDISVRWYPFTYSGYKFYNDGQIGYNISQEWRPYIGAGFRQRQFILAITTSYLGLGIFTGIDYQISSKIHLNGEIRFDQYQGSDQDTKAQMMNFLLGLAYHF